MRLSLSLYRLGGHDFTTPYTFLDQLLNLKVAKDRKGMAPSKPLLVLAILDLVEAGLVGRRGWYTRTQS